MDSIRWVTRKPPKMFTLASVTAKKPKAIAQAEVPSPVASRAPTMMTEEMPLVSDISGECSAGVTFQTT